MSGKKRLKKYYAIRVGKKEQGYLDHGKNARRTQKAFKMQSINPFQQKKRPEIT